jgi:hypothetical protein
MRKQGFSFKKIKGSESERKKWRKRAATGFSTKKKKAKPAALLKSRKDRRRGLFCRK